ncbi:hypothetical protein AK812_SmicGene7658 [Symbiodinium microadriaticum]|uniref:Uncharacterized protein n=1 Tax=Symbiodinium microadriaticum TaxID=2951 RepID=A0A1Q9EN33_SYMMI|nr:hypothetical protein AK812_SmicGene7658 [Symbiodinium microadriaticum]
MSYGISLLYYPPVKHGPTIFAFDFHSADLLMEVRMPLLSNHPLFRVLKGEYNATLRTMLTQAVKQESSRYMETVFAKGSVCHQMYFVDGPRLLYSRDTGLKSWLADRGVDFDKKTKKSPARRVQNMLGRKTQFLESQNELLQNYELPKGSYLCEACIWADKWINQGDFISTSHSKLVTIRSDAFAEAVSKHEDSKRFVSYYARHFVEGLRKSFDTGESNGDIFQVDLYDVLGVASPELLRQVSKDSLNRMSWPRTSFASVLRAGAPAFLRGGTSSSSQLSSNNTGTESHRSGTPQGEKVGRGVLPFQESFYKLNTIPSMHDKEQEEEDMLLLLLLKWKRRLTTLMPASCPCEMQQLQAGDGHEVGEQFTKDLTRLQVWSEEEEAGGQNLNVDEAPSAGTDLTARFRKCLDSYAQVLWTFFLHAQLVNTRPEDRLKQVLSEVESGGSTSFDSSGSGLHAIRDRDAVHNAFQRSLRESAIFHGDTLLTAAWALRLLGLAGPWSLRRLHDFVLCALELLMESSGHMAEETGEPHDAREMFLAACETYLAVPVIPRMQSRMQSCVTSLRRSGLLPEDRLKQVLSEVESGGSTSFDSSGSGLHAIRDRDAVHNAFQRSLRESVIGRVDRLCPLDVREHLLASFRAIFHGDTLLTAAWALRLLGLAGPWSLRRLHDFVLCALELLMESSGHMAEETGEPHDAREMFLAACETYLAVPVIPRMQSRMQSCVTSLRRSGLLPEDRLKQVLSEVESGGSTSFDSSGSGLHAIRDRDAVHNAFQRSLRESVIGRVDRLCPLDVREHLLVLASVPEHGERRSKPTFPGRFLEILEEETPGEKRLDDTRPPVVGQPEVLTSFFCSGVCSGKALE